jgi:hypothetical protein
MAAAHNRRLVLEIERALLAEDPQRREAVFTFLLPELIQVEPQLVVELMARLEPGAARDTLRTELARQWISKDRDAAIRWMKSLPDAGERRAGALAAAQTIASVAPEQAIHVADQFGVGSDGYLERVMQTWAADNPDAVTRWLATQPDGPRKQQMAERVRRAAVVRD